MRSSPVREKTSEHSLPECICDLDARSVFPTAGPLESSSLSLFDSAFHGERQGVRDLLMRRRAYVDVCDSRGLTALHFATYNGHIDVVNLLLDFGANVNQFADDGLTPLSIAFLLHYGNDPQLTINTALEHADPKALTVTMDTARSLVQGSRSTRNFASRASTVPGDEVKLPLSSIELLKLSLTEKMKTTNYGYELTDALRERIAQDSSRVTVASLIKYVRLSLSLLKEKSRTTFI